MVNPVAAGFVAGAVLARNSGPKAAFGGGIAFAAFSAAIDLFLRRETPEYARLSMSLTPRLINITARIEHRSRLDFTPIDCIHYGKDNHHSCFAIVL